jgi:membrane fusion protein, multidrug efflux system
MQTISMSKPMKKMLLGVGILFASIFIYKAFSSMMLHHYLANQNHLVTVSATTVGFSDWDPQIKAVGSLRAIKGVNVTTSLAGMVKNIYFAPGANVKEGTVLVQLNADAELGELQSIKAQAELAKITYKRDKAQYAARAISKQTLDSDEQTLNNLEGQVAKQAAIVAKKTIRAPFTGRLGINYVNPGQYLNTGDTITSLQTLDPIYIDFYLPQQTLAELKVGLMVNLKSDSFPGKIFKGSITTINPVVDVDTRNIQVEATIANAEHLLVPGMFANIEVITGAAQRFLTLPQTAVSYNPYGDIVYLLAASEDKKNKGMLIANQVFVKTGKTRGDQVQILSGIKAGDTIVTSGQLKLKNGSAVSINNTVVPKDSPFAKAPNQHE